MRFYIYMLLLLAMTVLPTLAEGPGLRENPDGMRITMGRVLDVNRELRQMRIAVMVQVSDPNAAGKVPDELAQKAAALLQEADRASRDGKAVRARMLRQQATQLLSWREVETVVSATEKRVSIMALRRVPASTISIGMRLGLSARFDGLLTPDQLPARVTQTNDSRILNGDERKTFIRTVGKPMPQTNTTFLEVVGYVTSISPLTLRVNETAIIVDDSQRFSVQQVTPVDAREVQPGQRLYAQVHLKNEVEIDRVTRVVIMLMNTGSPLPPDQSLGN